TIFYSTHILDDVERVSDHVAILDQGRLVRAAPTQELLTSFTRDRVRVVVGRVTDATAGGLAALPGVASVELAGRDHDQATFLGLRNLIRKDLAEWLHGKRPWIVLGVTTSVFALTAANARITEWAARSFPADAGDGPAKIISVLPLDNVLIALGTQFIVLAAI